MGDTKIEWCDSVWNPLRGCSRVSEGCRNCYAERVAARFSKEIPAEDDSGKFMKPMPYHGLATMTEQGPRWTGNVRLVKDMIGWPLRKKKPLRIFVNSMSDLFHEKVPSVWIDKIFDVMIYCPHHTFQILTKRPARMIDYMRDRQSRFGAAQEAGYLKHVWLGVSVEDQQNADARIPLLLDTPSSVRFISYEPALGAVDLSRYAKPGFGWLDWIIIGGESGPGARPFDVRWAQEVVRLGSREGVAVFVKQIGARPMGIGLSELQRSVPDASLYRWPVNRKGGDMSEWPEDLRVREFPR